MSDFSIDYILHRAGDKYLGTNASLGVLERIKLHAWQYANCPVASGSELLQHSFQQSPQPVFDWLQYTRYHPPKLPRAFRQGPAKRTPGRLPRIPFSPEQLLALENAYKNSKYLSAEEANRLAESLQLTNTRVKIWFQNRRARARRERREREESCDSTFSSVTSSPEPECAAFQSSSAE